ncbi:outer membrane beta-barrel protein [Sphingobacterium corticis]|uniref:Outer membrane beta-barrel protein n=1 Tax=Sphingobacterium corticis TaxID=1812823 RepID=A0ABW5NNK6_9SPHI
MFNYPYFRKNILVIVSTIVFICTFHSASAQYGYPQDRNMRLGLVFNPNISWMNFEGARTANAGVRFGYGLMADFGFARNYYFSTGLIINDLKTETNAISGEAASIGQEIRLKYAEVPLAIKLKTEEKNFGRIYGQFGVTAGLRVSAKQRLVDSDQAFESLSGADLIRLGLQIGTGVEWNLGGNLGLLTGLSYNNGFTRAIRTQGDPKLSYVALQFGLLF